MYSAEKNMTQAVAAWAEKRGLLSKAEFETLSGPCDLFCLRLSKHALRTRRRKMRIKTVLEGLVVEAARNRTLDRCSLPLTRAELQELVLSLQTRGILTTRRGVSPAYKDLAREMFAIEIKIRRVSEAIRQATAHLQYADGAYVALPKAVAEGVKRTWGTIASPRIGLLSVSRRECRVLVSPKAERTTRHATRLVYGDRFLGLALETFRHSAS